MTKLPVKVLLDENKKPFVPYMTTDTVFYGDTDKTVSETLDEAVAEVSALASTVNELSEEVNAKIETVFTYKGNVANYNALQQIVNPNVGDVYNTTDTDKNYAWSGTKWDDLGGIVDLSNYYTKNETKQAINDALKNVEVNVDLSDYYNKAQTDKAISDALEDVEVEVDLSDYYNKTEVDTAISEAIPNIDPSMFLKPKGFVNSESDLPSMGQPSGTVGSALATLSTDITQIREGLEKQTSSRYLLYLDLGWDYWSPADAGVDAYLTIATDYPETIKAIGISPSGRVSVQVHSTSEKPVYINKRRIITSKIGYTWQYGSGEWSGSYTLASDYDYNIESELVVQGIYGNLPNVLLHYPCPNTMLSVSQSSGTTSRMSYQNSDSVKLEFADNYIYNPGMQMLKFDPDTYQASWVLADPQEEPNSMYLVGPNNEQYISTTDRWVHVSKHDSYTKSEIDVMLGEIESVLDDILNGG